MATIKKNWQTEQTIMNAVSVTTGSWSDDVDLETDGMEGAHVVVDVDFPTSPTDDLIVQIHGSLDGNNYDDTALTSLTISKGTDPNQVSFVVKDLAHFKLFCKRSGTTDTIAVTAKCQRWSYITA